MDQRYSRVSTIITTNLDLPDWYALFDKKPLVDALLDRCSITASPFVSTARRCAARIRQRHRRPVRRAAPTRPDTRATFGPVAIGIEFPANDDRCAVLAPIKVRCSQSSPCSLQSAARGSGLL